VGQLFDHGSRLEASKASKARRFVVVVVVVAVVVVVDWLFFHQQELKAWSCFPITRTSTLEG
jgi:hypothetical protein